MIFKTFRLPQLGSVRQKLGSTHLPPPRPPRLNLTKFQLCNLIARVPTVKLKFPLTRSKIVTPHIHSFNNLSLCRGRLQSFSTIETVRKRKMLCCLFYIVAKHGTNHINKTERVGASKYEISKSNKCFSSANQ